MPALILWTHALAALLFAGAAMTAWRRDAGGLPWRVFALALAATSLWALAVAGIGTGDVTVRIVQALRDLAWLGFMFAAGWRGRRPGYGLVATYAVVAVLAAMGAALALVGEMGIDAPALAALQATRLLLRIMVALSALVLTVELAGATGRGGGPRLIAAALAGSWMIDLTVVTVAYAGGGWPPVLIAARGAAMAAVALLLWIAADRGGDWTIALSRPVTMRTLAAATLALYAGVVIALSRLAEASGGEYARLIQAGLVIGATTTLLTLAANPWLRAWLRVKVAKHLFTHRYDYRAAWQRFSETLGQPGEAAQPLATRVVRAMAELTESPAGLLLEPTAGGLAIHAFWNWEVERRADSDAALAAYIAETGRILELDAIRAGSAPAADAAVAPAWMLDWHEAWALVPLAHGGQFAGAILLARPPVDRALDWEDYDLLRVAGRQAASCLAEDRAHAALAEAARFDEFNRRFAFIMHDIKNLVSQLSLTARNAERHAGNPDFRADMVATLRDSSDRLQALLGRLSHHGGGRAEPPQPIDGAALLRRVAARFGKAVETDVAGAPLPLAEPARLETVLGHLVQNAIDASAPGASVRLGASSSAGGVVIAVTDTGEGMSAAFVRDRLFRPFASTKPGGFGLGVFEARQAIEAMGGSVEVDSREGEGTCFRLLLPAAPALESAA